eukprot:m.32212 g.32212  ORF g.32212 m.32212 type:complete len:54 (+) comp31603_c0_seq1:58-219(+)
MLDLSARPMGQGSNCEQMKSSLFRPLGFLWLEHFDGYINAIRELIVRRLLRQK